MRNFGETIRSLRVAQNLGLREAASMVGISPTYLSRIERGKENPPRPEVIKELARILAVDPDVLFRLASSTDPEMVDFLHNYPEAMNLLRFLKDSKFTNAEINKLLKTARDLKSTIR